MASVLVIDDEAQIRRMLRRVLETEGYEVMDAADGSEGIGLYREHPTDLVLTDILMPEKEGLETIMALKRDFPEVTIFAMSGGGLINAGCCLDMAKSLGAARVYTSPADRAPSRISGSRPSTRGRWRSRPVALGTPAMEDPTERGNRGMPTEPFDLSRVETRSVEGRESLVGIDRFATLPEPGATAGELLSSLPGFLAGDGLRELVRAVVSGILKSSISSRCGTPLMK